MTDLTAEDSNHNRGSRSRGRDTNLAFSSWTSWQRWATVVAISVVGLVVLGVALDAAASAGRIHPGVSVGGVVVGGKTPADAAKLLGSELPRRSAGPVVVTYQQKSWTVKPEQVGLSFHYPALVSSAMAVGRTGGIGESLVQKVTAWFAGVQVDVAATAEPSKLEKTLGTIARGVNVEPRDAAVKIEGTSVSVVPSAEGVALEADMASRTLLKSFTSTERTFEAPVGRSGAKITDEAATAAKVVAERMISGPVMVSFGKKTWKFAPRDIARMIEFESVPASATSSTSGDASGDAGSLPTGGWTLDPLISATEAATTIAPRLGAGVGREAADATFKTSNGSVSIIPSKTGIGPDIKALSVGLTQILKDATGASRAIELRTRLTLPKRSTEAARAMGIKTRISTFTTTYGSGNRPRVNNIHTLGNALDGTLVAPGATFSFNGAIGERTAAKGYQTAAAIVDGKLVPQLGGGICQVGTTMFNSVFLSGFPVLERRNHSFYISHYPTGRDATVSWGGPDLKFKNDGASWLLVSVSYTDSSITISLYGTDPGYTVSSTTGPFTDVRPIPVEQTPDPTLTKGAKVVQDQGQTGRTCVVKRIVSKGGTVVRTDTFRSVYKPVAQVVRVGTKSAKPAVAPKP